MTSCPGCHGSRGGAGRCFLLRYFAAPPLHPGLSLALLLSSLDIWSGTHLCGRLSQRVSALLGAAILGALLALIFVLTGNLLVPIILHSAVDLSELLVIRTSKMEWNPC
jgi:membrane protease YdiL (CAAX protease family)